MAIKWFGFQDFVAQQIAIVQTSAAAAIDAGVGSVTLALAQSVAGVALWLQAEIAQVMSLTRAATSTGADLDTWLADWSLIRAPAQFAIGMVTFSSYTSTGTITIPAGSLVSTGPAGQQFSVVADTSNPNFNAASQSYILGGGLLSLSTPVVALTAGANGNVIAGTVNSFVTPLAGVDVVSNQASFTGGTAAATDTAARKMFVDYISGLNRGTPAAIRYAARSVSPTSTFYLADNTDSSGAYRPGWFVLVVDDGTGFPPQSLLTSIAGAVQQYRAIGTFAAVRAPIVTSIIVSMNISTLPGTVDSDTSLAIVTDVSSYINALPVGSSLSYLRVAQISFDASPNVVSVTNLLMNGDTADISVGLFGVIKVSTVAVTVLNP